MKGRGRRGAFPSHGEWKKSMELGAAECLLR